VAIDVTVSVVIEKPRAEVAAYVVDPANETGWIVGIRKSTPLTDGPVRVGVQVAREASFAGRRIEYVNEVVEYDPGTLLKMRSVKAPFPMEITYTFEDAAGGTRFSNHITGGPGGIARVLSPLMAMGVKRNVSKDLQRLKAVLEG